MKLKRIILLAVALVMCISLCSCLDLDAEREKHAKLQDDGSILLNGHKYVLLPECEGFSPYFQYSTGRLNLTDPDVPLLLSSGASEGNVFVSVDGKFIVFNEFSFYYCREDYYDKVTAAMEEEKEYRLCFESSTYDHNIADYVFNYHFLTDAQADVIENTLKDIENTNPVYSTENGKFAYYNQYFDFSVMLEKRTENLWFTSSDDTVILQLCYSNADDVYYLLVEDAMSYDYRLYPIEKEHNDILDDLMAIHIGVEIDW